MINELILWTITTEWWVQCPIFLWFCDKTRLSLVTKKKKKEKNTKINLVNNTCTYIHCLVSVNQASIYVGRHNLFPTWRNSIIHVRCHFFQTAIINEVKKNMMGGESFTIIPPTSIFDQIWGITFQQASYPFSL